MFNTLFAKGVTPTPERADFVYHGEAGYLKLMADIMAYGSETPDRTGVGRRKLFERYLRFDLRKGFPMLTGRNTPPASAFKEFWAFLNGITHIHTHLSQEGINFWEGNTTREFLDDRNLHNLPVGHGGKSYGFQIRHFGGDYDADFNGVGGIDQLKKIHHALVNTPFDSRILLSMWNPVQEHEMALPPCWWGHQFLVTLDENGNKVLNLTVNSRSADLLFGTPYNVCQYAFYLLAMAEATGMIAGELACRLTDVHIYGKLSDLNKPELECDKASQMHYVAETLQRSYSDAPVKVSFSKPLNNLDDILALTFDDVVIENYHPNLTKYVARRPKMAV